MFSSNNRTGDLFHIEIGFGDTALCEGNSVKTVNATFRNLIKFTTTTIHELKKIQGTKGQNRSSDGDEGWALLDPFLVFSVLHPRSSET